MVWKHNGVNIKEGRSWTDKDGIKHPSNWMIWSDEDKKGFGLTWENDVDTSYDERFYWSKGVEKKLADINEVDKDGKAIINPHTGKQLVTLGLKSIWIAQTKTTANTMLSQTDWYVTRKAEADKAIPSNISKYRADVRTATATIETKINNCSKLSQFIALFDVPVDSEGKPTGNAPIFDFPDEVK
tara:strand:- start:9 stop:563 length:555 start_codon:yes stop_codon:yes gene_type:complete